MERTREDYAEIMTALERFCNKKVWIVYQFRDGQKEGPLLFGGLVLWDEECSDHSVSAADFPYNQFDPRPAFVQVCQHLTIELQDTRLRVTGHGCVTTATLLEP